MKRIYGALSIILFTIFFVSGCGSDNGSILKRQAAITEEFAAGLTEAQNADDAVKVIDNYTEGLKELLPDLIAFHEKYPEYQQGNVPKEIKDDAVQVEEAATKMAGAMMKLSRFMMDPKVQEAMTRMGEEVSKLGE